MSYDIIGDIHGCVRTLEALLRKLGYSHDDGAYRHPDRQVVFLGDFIDRGPHQREVIDIVRPMVENSSALAVMGNHEFNAISYATSSDKGFLREHSDKNAKQHASFLEAYPPDTDEYQDVIGWFRELPLWLDLGGIRVVHACWEANWVEKIQTAQRGSTKLSRELLVAANTKGTWQHAAIETLLKGKEIPLPHGQHFHDKDGNPRHEIRVRWWDQSATTYRDAFMGPESARPHIPEDAIEGDHLTTYGLEEVPVFLGHYWLEGEPEPLAPNIACVDYSVAQPGGRLVAYRWDNQPEISRDQFVSSERCD